MRPMLFVGVGALLAGGRPGRAPVFAPYARPFMHWASHRYDVAWLNPGALSGGVRLSSELGLPQDAVALAGYRTYRHEALLRLSVPWAWVDAGLVPEELAWIRANAPERYIPVASGTGVTPAHRAAVLAVLG